MLTRVYTKRSLRVMLPYSTALLSQTRAVQCTAQHTNPRLALAAAAPVHRTLISSCVGSTNMHTMAITEANAATASTRERHTQLLQRSLLPAVTSSQVGHKLNKPPCNIRCFSSDSSDRPSVTDLEGGMSSEAIGMDEAAIDAIPADNLPAGASRTEGPPPTGSSPSSQPEMSPERGDPQPDSSIPPSGPSGSEVPYESEQPPAGKPRSAGPEIDDSSSAIDGAQPEVQEPPASVNPDRVPFWGS